MQTNMVTPHDTASTSSSSVDENTNGDNATQPPTAAVAMRKRLSDSDASDNAVATTPAAIAFTVWVGPSGRMTASIGNQVPIRIATQRENIGTSWARQQQVRFQGAGAASSARRCTIHETVAPASPRCARFAGS